MDDATLEEFIGIALERVEYAYKMKNKYPFRESQVSVTNLEEYESFLLSIKKKEISCLDEGERKKAIRFIHCVMDSLINLLATKVSIGIEHIPLIRTGSGADYHKLIAVSKRLENSLKKDVSIEKKNESIDLAIGVTRELKGDYGEHLFRVDGDALQNMRVRYFLLLAFFSTITLIGNTFLLIIEDNITGHPVSLMIKGFFSNDAISILFGLLGFFVISGAIWLVHKWYKNKWH